MPHAAQLSICAGCPACHHDSSEFEAGCKAPTRDTGRLHPHFGSQLDGVHAPLQGVQHQQPPAEWCTNTGHHLGGLHRLQRADDARHGAQHADIGAAAARVWARRFWEQAAVARPCTDGAPRSCNRAGDQQVVASPSINSCVLTDVTQSAKWMSCTSETKYHFTGPTLHHQVLDCEPGAHAKLV